MKVLMSAYYCIPDRGGELDVGWHCVRQIGQFHDVWVLLQEDGRQEIQLAVSRDPLPRVRFVYVKLPTWTAFLKKRGWGEEPHYYLWQLAAYFVGRRLQGKIGLDLVHHVTLVRYWMPSFLALLPVPFVWGPVGGGESAPRAFWSSFSLRGKIFELARDVARKVGECDPFLRYAARKAAPGLATTEQTADRMRKLGCQRVSVLTQVALLREEIEYLSNIPLLHDGPFRLISIGRLVHWKGFHIGLRAFAEFQRGSGATEYWIVGEGPERKKLETLARKLGIADKVKFWGSIPRGQVLEKLAACDALLHPSLHESGGWVCAEAMAAGRPVICFDLGGPALQVTNETGVKVPASGPNQAVAYLAAAMARLAGDPALRTRMGCASRRRAEKHFGWDKKGQVLAVIYEEVLQKGRISTC